MTQRKQRIYGYRLSAADGSTSPWRFVDPTVSIDFELVIQLKNGAVLRYNTKTNEYLLHWAHIREITVDLCEFEFDPDTMTFTKIEE